MRAGDVAFLREHSGTGDGDVMDTSPASHGSHQYESRQSSATPTSQQEQATVRYTSSPVARESVSQPRTSSPLHQYTSTPVEVKPHPVHAAPEHHPHHQQQPLPQQRQSLPQPANWSGRESTPPFVTGSAAIIGKVQSTHNSSVDPAALTRAPERTLPPAAPQQAREFVDESNHSPAHPQHAHTSSHMHTGANARTIASPAANFPQQQQQHTASGHGTPVSSSSAANTPRSSGMPGQRQSQQQQQDYEQSSGSSSGGPSGIGKGHEGPGGGGSAPQAQAQANYHMHAPPAQKKAAVNQVGAITCAAWASGMFLYLEYIYIRSCACVFTVNMHICNSVFLLGMCSCVCVYIRIYLNIRIIWIKVV